MMRWKVVVLGLALTFAVTAGCKQQLFIQECDLQEYEKLGVPPRGECDPHILPPTTDMKAPTTLLDLTRKERPITLAECIAIALEHGTTGIESVRLFGTANDDLNSIPGQPFSTPQTDAIRVLAIDPAVFGNDIEGSLSKFDAFWRTTMSWNASDQSAQTLGAFQSNGNFAAFLTQLVKPLPSGGDVGVTFNTNYQHLSQPITGVTTLNPNYQTGLTFNFDQPLLQGFGVDINQLLPQHPLEGTQNLQRSRYALYSTTNIDNGILVARLRFDQSRAEFERHITFMLTNVEVAYWNLYGAYFNLYASEQAMRLSLRVWDALKAQWDAGRIAGEAYYPQLGQYEQFRGDRLAAVGQVLERERQLRALLGLPPEDGTRLLPIDAPTLTPYQPDWQTAANEALALRPELVMAREDVKLRQFNVLREKNNLLPDLRLTSTYGITGLGSRLDGNGSLGPTPANPGLTDNALRSLSSTHFDNWSIGLALNVPIGYRAAYASIRAARLRLAQGYLALRDQEDKALRFLALQYRTIFEAYDTIQARRAQRLAYADALKVRLEQIKAGKVTYDVNLQDAERQWTAALQSEYQAVVNYNNALAEFEFAKGTILQHDNVIISEGPVPCCAQVRAVEHERQRSIALVARERARPNGGCCGAGASCAGPAKAPTIALPEMPKDHAPALPALMKEKAAPGEPLTDLSRVDEAPAPADLTATGQTPATPETTATDSAPAATLPVTVPAATPAAPVVNDGPKADQAPVMSFSKGAETAPATPVVPRDASPESAKEPVIMNFSKDTMTYSKEAAPPAASGEAAPAPPQSP
jgi:outer membrane protein TolC